MSKASLLRRPGPRWLASIAVTLLTALGAAAMAQETPEETPPVPDSLVLGSVSISTGFPGFQRFALSGSIQYRFVGLSARIAPTPAGAYFGIAARGYIPVPGFVPLFVSVGGGLYGESTTLNLTVGGHVPISENWRIDFEAGGSRVTAFGDSQWLPFVSAGVSFVMPLDITPGVRAAGAAGGTESGAGASGSCPAPSHDSLEAAFHSAVNSFIRNGQATYGGSYTDLRYDYDVVSVDMSDTDGTVTATYEGSAREILTGQRISARGSASASFQWSGCRWSRTSFDY